MKARYGHTNLVARDWRRLAGFYSDLFGCEPCAAGARLPRPDRRGGVRRPGVGHGGAFTSALPGHGEQGPTSRSTPTTAREAPSPQLPIGRVGPYRFRGGRCRCRAGRGAGRRRIAGRRGRHRGDRRRPPSHVVLRHRSGGQHRRAAGLSDGRVDPPHSRRSADHRRLPRSTAPALRLAPGTPPAWTGACTWATPTWRPEPTLAQTVDATGMVVAPGFIDLHSHGGLVIMADPRHEPKVRQGVTTEVIGVDGNGYAPFHDHDDLAAFVDLNAGLDGRPGDRLRLGHGGQLHRPLRPGPGGERRGHDRQQRAAHRRHRLGRQTGRRAVANMRAMLREAMEEGAFGVSSGLDYPPGSYASTDELAALTAEAAAAGGFYHTHVRYALGDRFLDPFREAIEIGRRGDGPVHLTHFYHRQTHPGGPEQLLGPGRRRAPGRHGRHLRQLPVRVGLHPPADPAAAVGAGGWTDGAQGAPRRSRPVRDRLRSRAGDARRGLHQRGGLGRSATRCAFTQPENLRWESRTLAEVMQETGRDAVDTICDLLLAENLGVAQVTSGPWSETLPHFVRHPVGMVGTDSTFLGREAVAANLRLVPADPRPVRARRAAALARGGGAQDDRRAGRPPGPDRSRPAARRLRRRPGRLRSAARSVERHLRRAATVSRRDRVRGRQRRAGGGCRRAHRRAARRAVRRGATSSERLPGGAIVRWQHERPAG